MLIIGKLGQPGQEPVESVRISWSLAKYNPGGLGKYKYKHDNLLMIIPADCSHWPLLNIAQYRPAHSSPLWWQCRARRCCWVAFNCHWEGISCFQTVEWTL